MKTHPILKVAAIAALLVLLLVGAQQSGRAGTNAAVIAFLQQALSWLRKTPADGAYVTHVAGIDGIDDIASLTTLLKQVVKSLSAA
jgi:hypothetical protein